MKHINLKPSNKIIPFTVLIQPCTRSPENCEHRRSKPADPGESVLRHDGGRPEDGEDEGDAAADGLLTVKHGALGNEQLLLEIEDGVSFSSSSL